MQSEGKVATPVSVHAKRFHRKDAKNAKCFIVFIREFLCVLCVFAVKSVFMNEPYSSTAGMVFCDAVEGIQYPANRSMPCVQMRLFVMSEYKEYVCVVCGFVYSEADGLPDEGFPPGTRWDDIPANWVCPECGAAKEDFEMVEI
jgi:rubredoxin